MRKLLTLFTALLFVGSMWGAKITNVNNIESGKKYYIGATKSDDSDWYLSVANHGTAGTGLQGTAVSTTSDAEEFTFTQVTGGWTIQFNNGNYLSLASSKANGKVNVVENAAVWVITETDAGKLNLKINDHCLQRNTGTSTNFGSYGSGQLDVWLEVVPVISAVTIDPAIEGGTLSITGAASLSSVVEGTELTVTATPDAVNHYIGGTITVKDGEDNDVTASVLSGSTLTMPDYAITVSADFTATYAVNLIANGGSIALDYTAGGAEEGYAIAGTEIMATATADDAHTFNSLAVSANALDVVVDENVATFTMPAEAVSVTATFDEKSTPTISVDETALAFGIVNINTTPIPQSFHVSGVALSEGALTITSNNSAFTVSPASIDVNGTLDDTEITVTPVTTKAGNFNGKITISGGGAEAKEVALSLVVKDIYTITWHVCGEDDELTYVVEDNKIVPIANPTLDEKYETKTFMGWAESAIDGSSASATLVDFATFAAPTANDEFWAVFATADDIDEVVIEQSGTTAPKDFTVTVNAESKTGFYQDGSDNNFPGTRYVQVKVTENTQLIPIEPETITLTANLGGGTAKADLANSVYAVLIDKDGNALGDQVMLTDAILSQEGDPFSKSMPTENYASVRGVKVTHDKDASYNVRYYGITLSYQVSLYSEYETTVPEKSATALDNTEVEGKAVKVLRNGILLIEKNGHTYNAQGLLIK